MRLLVSGATPAVRIWHPKRPDRLGSLLGPGKAFVTSMLGQGIPYAADNGCFRRFDQPAVERMIERLSEQKDRPLFVVAPDVVADSRATLRLFQEWGPRIRSMGLPVALVGQDGLVPHDVPWSEIDAYFVGGSTEWKLSKESFLLVQEARSRQVHTHMGRVNSSSSLRIRTAVRWGCQSIDGTGFTWYANVRIPRAIRWIDQAMFLDNQPSLFPR